jgi:hypothetical protein
MVVKSTRLAAIELALLTAGAALVVLREREAWTSRPRRGGA